MTIAIPLVGPLAIAVAGLGLWSMHAASAVLARRVAIAVAAMLVVLGTVLAAFVHAGGTWVDPTTLALVGEPRRVFGLDDFNAPLLPFSAALVLVVIAGLPRARVTAATAGRALVQIAATWVLFTTLDLGVLALAWLATLGPAFSARAAGRRMAAAYLLTSAALVLAAVVLIAIAARARGVPAPLSLLDLEAVGGERLDPWRVLPLLLTAIVIRKGAFPFHSWIPTSSSHGSPSLAALLLGPQLGAFVLVRVAIPLYPGPMADAIPIVGHLALLAALYGATVGLASSDLRRAFGWLLVSQSALVLVGLECFNADGIAGGLTLWMSAGLALAGFAVTIEAVEARVGTRSLHAFTALRAPKLGALFLVLGLAAVGLPGTLGFVAEDLLVHGVLESYPGIGVVIVLATAANGFSVMRAFMRTFYGPPPRGAPVTDVLPRELAVLGSVAVVLVALGLFPRPIVDTRGPVAQRLATLLDRGDAN